MNNDDLTVQLDPQQFVREVVNNSLGRNEGTAYCFGCHGDAEHHLGVYMREPGLVTAYGLIRSKATMAAMHLLERGLTHLGIDWSTEFRSPGRGRTQYLWFQVPG